MSLRTPLGRREAADGVLMSASVAALVAPVSARRRSTVELEAPWTAGSDAARPTERILFVASSGGHIAELHRLATRMTSAEDSVWVTFDGPQTRSLLAGKESVFLPYVAPRDLQGVLRSFVGIRALLRSGRFDRVISTGAAVAVGAFAASRSLGIPGTYIESVARLRGPSLTGRIVAALHLAETRTQHAFWAGRRWRAWPSVLGQFRKTPLRGAAGDSGPLRVFVTVGTIKPYRFDAVVDAVLRSGLADEDTVWQLGSTTRTDLPGRAVEQMPWDEFVDCVRRADVVVTHAGVGTILDVLELGSHPVVGPRAALRGEHVDDHQQQIADHVEALGLATVVDADLLDARHLRAAAALRTRVAV
jgi:UDP-N-acetylglucosamine--N-acetylmuramyl-(pentapeptide) pyrophosphoryl-undecaprenol N-acetylglucosamine transferase